MLTYRIQAVRTTSVGGWGTFVVTFGTNAGGQVTATLAGGGTLAA